MSGNSLAIVGCEEMETIMLKGVVVKMNDVGGVRSIVSVSNVASVVVEKIEAVDNVTEKGVLLF